MSRSGYHDDGDNWQLIKWRGQVASATRGKRGQDFFKALLEALDAMEDKVLIANDLEFKGQFCTLGVLGHAKGIDMSKIDPHEPEVVGMKFNIAYQLAQEVVYMNDEAVYYKETPERRWIRMRKWVSEQIKVEEKCEEAQ